ncbi:Acetyltransferase, GNAT family protein [Streptomyces venezuelae]|uniref:GNAT family N-acetyltransferase n=1 Tax=Streptomyces gardneri TaxID=66892 RepID=UPI0006E3A50C|nr:GNAT family N-acetyltransferase [Streptomyces gardneri]ALO11477.1 Acetyltransferase, GNAT family protein [Streptomyces venezuelae]QPK48381.1 GNAT family N-acetyltransferase [Streptomyces gardneri]WRK39846.1 GNAT family N-acetyltransferase [Streptomyces venezuelae]
MPSPELQRIHAFMSAFARRQAARVVDLPGGFAAYDDAFSHSRANNQVVIDTDVDTETLPALADEALGHLPHRLISVLDDATGAACAESLVRAGYTHSTLLVMVHEGPVPAGGSAEVVDLDALREPIARRWRGFLPDVDSEVIRHLVERREARRRGADVVYFIGSRTDEGDVASWADLYLDPATGTAQLEDLMTAEDHLRRGHADAVVATALSLAAAQDCGTRFLTAFAADWPRHWYERRGFSVIGRTHCFERG